MRLINYMEQLVENHVDAVCKAMKCCNCENCRTDVMAIALNALPPQYVATERGEVFIKVKDMATQYHTDIIMSISEAANQVLQRPRHN